jgi:hypothetical protein
MSALAGTAPTNKERLAVQVFGVPVDPFDYKQHVFAVWSTILAVILMLAVP